MISNYVYVPPCVCETPEPVNYPMKIVYPDGSRGKDIPQWHCAKCNQPIQSNEIPTTTTVSTSFNGKEFIFSR